MLEFINNNKLELRNLFLIIYIIMSLFTLLLYRIDKHKARKNKYRISEKTLLITPWLLGSFGGILGLYLVRHKTKHLYFVLNNILAFLIHVLIFIKFLL